MYSLERRRERYGVIYAWKILENRVPNFDSNGELIPKFNERIGRTCQIKHNVLNSSPKARKLRDSSFSWNACRAFNSIPKSIRNLSNCSVQTFKNHFDKYLLTIPDEPQLVGMTIFRRSDSNSNVHMRNV